MTTVFPAKTASARRVMLTNELTRIAGLPRRVLTPEQWEAFADRLTQVLKTPHGQMRLRPVQAVSLLEMTEVGGVFGPQRCGAGKTLLSLLSPSVLQRTKRKGFRPLLVVPAGLLEKTERDRRLLAEHWEIVQFLKVMSYEWLGRPQAANALEEYQPDLIILDECFPYDTKVITDQDEVSIGAVIEFGIGTRALSRSPEGLLEWKRIVRRSKKLVSDLVKVEHESGSFVCTGSHKIWTERGYVQARSLVRGDCLRELWRVDAAKTGWDRRWSKTILFQEMCCSGHEQTANAGISCATKTRDDVHRLSEKCLGQKHRGALLLNRLCSQLETRKEKTNHCVPRLRETNRSTEKRKAHAGVLLSCVCVQAQAEASCERNEASEMRVATQIYCENLRRVREGFPVSFDRSAQRQETLLRHVLFQSLEDENFSDVTRTAAHQRGDDVSASERSAAPRYSREDASKQPDARSCCHREDRSSVQRANISSSWRQWAADKRTTAVSREDGSADRTRDRNWSGERALAEFAAPLQSRSSPCVNEDCDRGRWGVSQNKEMAIPRSSQDSGTRSSRVVRVEVLEREGVERYFRSRGRDPYVYNFEVEGNHNYFADGILVSNCHKVRNTRSAVCRRFKRFFQERSRLEHILGPGGLDQVVCIAMSGTVTKRSLFDYAHIMRWCLPASHIPIPWHFQDLIDWADALDEKKERKQRDEAMTISSAKSPVVVDPVSGETRTKTRFNHGVIDPGELKMLCNDEETRLWDSGEKQRAARLAFRRRLIETPGVVATVESPIDASLFVRGVKIDDVGPAVEDAFERLRADWVTPDGVELWDGLEASRKARELALGFYYIWQPSPPKEWLGPRKVWAKFVRETLKHSKTLDSESQVRRWVHELSADPKLKPQHWTQVQFEEACAALLNWVEVRDSFEPNTVPVWIDTTALNYAASWCQQHRGIAWVEHTCFGERLEKDFGITYYGRKGRNGVGHLIDDHPPSQSLVASIAANKEGRNLQAWSENLIVSMPSSGLAIEQLISRTHRDGQEADEVLVEVIVSCWEHVNAFNQASADADYIQSSTGAPQKLMLAGVDFPQLGLLGFGRRWIK